MANFILGWGGQKKRALVVLSHPIEEVKLSIHPL